MQPMQVTAPLIAAPRMRPSRVDWRLGLPSGRSELSSRVLLQTEVHLSIAPQVVAAQTRLLALKICGCNPGNWMVSFGGVTTVVGRDGAFELRGGGGGPGGAWREMVVGRLEGRRVLISIYQCHLLADLGTGAPVSCKILFRGISWGAF
jgi:hypothetical protein